MNHPTASVIVATLNEVDNIDHVMDVALGADAVIEVIIADGGSEDGTIDRIRERQITDSRVQLLHNHESHQSAGLNRAASIARGEILVRMDAHTRYSDDYIAASLAAWRPGCAVGGPMRAEGVNRWERATAVAMGNPLAIGPGRFHHATTVEQVDTVYLGTFDRSDFLANGGYRRFPSGTVEDTDFYLRWREAGHLVLVDPAIRSWYRPRATWVGLATQYFRYGRGKAELLWVNGRLPSLRPLVPALLVAGAVSATAIGFVWSWVPLAVLLGAWFLALVAIGVRSPSSRVMAPLVAATMHVLYGIGIWWGAVRGKPRPRNLGISSAIPPT